MGQKTHPVGFRLGVIRSWDSKWYEEKNYAAWLHEDIRLRDYVRKKLASAGVSRVEIERAANKVKLSIFTPRPGIVIGKKGVGIEGLKKDFRASRRATSSSTSTRCARRRSTLSWWPRMWPCSSSAAWPSGVP